MNSFEQLGLSKQALARLERVGYTHPTEIQSKSIHIILSGQDIIASAQTGSGKTAAFALPIVEMLGKSSRQPRALVLVPTRELALQVKQQIDLLSHNTIRTVVLYGGTGYGTQAKQLERGADVLVATPGRLIDLMQRGDVSLSTIKILVLDEADRLMDLGFMPQIRRVIAKAPKERQTLMFSATIDSRIERLAQEYMKVPARVRQTTGQIEPSSIDQKFHITHEFSKDELLLRLVQGMDEGSVLIFTRTKRKATWVVERLRDANVPAEEIHGDISQNQRERTMKSYREGSFTVLVATDVAARGLDIPAINLVVNYDLPQNAEDYIHRIGRTGRAGRAGSAHSFVCEDEHHLMRDIERLVGRKLSDPGSASTATNVKALNTRRLKLRSRSSSW